MAGLRALLCLLAAFLVAPSGVRAHFSESFEAGTMADLYGECWRFRGATVSSVSPIAGNFSARTSVLSAVNVRVVGGPWVSLDGFDALSFSHRVDGLGDGPLTIEVVLINPAGETTVLFGQTYAATGTKVTQIPLPMTGIYRVEFRFAGDGGAARAYLDDVGFPAAEFSDLTTNDGLGRCMPLECGSSLDCLGKGSRTLCDFTTNRCVECRVVNDCEDLNPCTRDRCVMNRCESEPLCGVPDGGPGDGGPMDGGEDPDDGGPGDGGSAVGGDAAVGVDGGRDGAADGSTDAGGRYMTGGSGAPAGRLVGGGCASAGPPSPGGHGAWALGLLAGAGLIRRLRRRARQARS